MCFSQNYIFKVFIYDNSKTIWPIFLNFRTNINNLPTLKDNKK